ncbi:HpcH/HpaI aldolase/citrate lyase family protein [Salsipaludibacter albus]|uniref:HpcH/HpaI aldolase/citrate lyase family protein n=1 Tax=Salsipaludibacter albus TaxID=2849650 RepID=UPI001EE3E454
MLNRSWLYVPGDARDKLDGALERGSDAVIVDLEDSVVPSVKEQARATVLAWLDERATNASEGRRVEVWVRINAAGPWQDADLAELVGQPIDGIVVPKASTSAIATVHGVLEAAETLPTPRIAGLVEDALGVAKVVDLAATPGLAHLGLGEADLRADLHLDPSDDETELQPIRTAVVVASAAAGLRPPVGSTSTDYRDLAALRRSTDRLRRLGFVGRSAIHPAQVPVINAAFTPSRAEVERARDLVARLEAATDDGRGIVIDDRGRMVDEAVVRRARLTLELADVSAADG